MEDRIAQAISYLLHPLLIPTYFMFLLLQLPLFQSQSFSMNATIWLLSMVFVFTFLLPVVMILTMYYFRLIDSIELKERSQRTLPLLFTAVSGYGLIYIMRQSGLPGYFQYVLYCMLVALVTGLLVNLFYKISLHTLSWGAATAALTGLSLNLGLVMPATIAGAMMLSGLVGFARLKLNAHNSAQVYLGFAAGVAVVTIFSIVI